MNNKPALVLSFSQPSRRRLVEKLDTTKEFKRNPADLEVLYKKSLAQYRASRRITVGKTFVHETLQRHAYEIQIQCRKLKHAKPIEEQSDFEF